MASRAAASPFDLLDNFVLLHILKLFHYDSALRFAQTNKRHLQLGLYKLNVLSLKPLESIRHLPLLTKSKKATVWLQNGKQYGKHSCRFSFKFDINDAAEKPNFVLKEHGLVVKVFVTRNKKKFMQFNCFYNRMGQRGSAKLLLVDYLTKRFIFDHLSIRTGNPNILPQLEKIDSTRVKSLLLSTKDDLDFELCRLFHLYPKLEALYVEQVDRYGIYGIGNELFDIQQVHQLQSLKIAYWMDLDIDDKILLKMGASILNIGPTNCTSEGLKKLLQAWSRGDLDIHEWEFTLDEWRINDVFVEVFGFWLNGQTSVTVRGRTGNHLNFMAFKDAPLVRIRLSK